MKHQRSKRRGAAVILCLVIIGILAVLSTVTLKQLVRDHAHQERLLRKTQIELLQSDINRDLFRQQFSDNQLPMLANIKEPRLNPQGEYILLIDLGKEPVSGNVEFRKIR